MSGRVSASSIFVVSQVGGTPDKGNPEYWNGEIPWVSPKDMKSTTIENTEDHITTDGLESSATKLVAPGAVLLVMRSGILRHSIPVAINRVSIALNQGHARPGFRFRRSRRVFPCPTIGRASAAATERLEQSRQYG